MSLINNTVCSATPCARFSFVSIKISVCVCLSIHKWISRIDDNETKPPTRRCRTYSTECISLVFQSSPMAKNLTVVHKLGHFLLDDVYLPYCTWYVGMGKCRVFRSVLVNLTWIGTNRFLLIVICDSN